jgi:retinoid hydroxylase
MNVPDLATLGLLRGESMAESALPPGSDGFPILGETLPFVRDMFGFMRERFAKHGPIFRSHVLGTTTIFITGADLTDVWLDESCIQREGSFPKPVAALFGGRSLPLLDGPEHRIRKRLLLSAFRRDAFASYLPKLESAVTASLARACDVTKKEGDVGWLAEMKRLAVDGILRAVLGMEPGGEMDAMLTDYGLVTRGFTGLPINLPGTDFRAGLRARDRIFARLQAAIEAHAATPSDDGLSRLLAAEIDGVKIEPNDLVLELHHVVLAGLIIFAELACTVIALTEQPTIREKAAREVERVIGDKKPLSLDRLGQMTYLDAIVNETKRACPNVPVSFGRAKKDFELGGYAIKEGFFVFMSVYANNIDPRFYPAPEKFEPERFSDERRENEKHVHAYQPQGAGTDAGHRCAGVDFSSIFMKVFTALLVRDVRWTLPAQDLSPRWDIIPPEPKDGLRAVVEEA